MARNQTGNRDHQVTRQHTRMYNWEIPTNYMFAKNELVGLRELIVNFQNGRLSPQEFIRTACDIIQLVCTFVNRHLRNTDFHIDVHYMLLDEELGEHINKINQLLERHLPFRLSFNTGRRIGGIVVELVPRPLNLAPKTVKRGSEYFKELSLVNDLTIPHNAPSKECTICFDEFNSQDIIATGCDHIYCVTCIKDLSTSLKDKSEKPPCPMCRTDIVELKFGNIDILHVIQDHLNAL